MKTIKITVGKVKSLLESGKKIKVTTKNGEFVKITNYVDKGYLDTFKVTLDNGYQIKVSREHKFFTNVGWLETKDILPHKTKIYCDDSNYHVVESVENIGKFKIVDITVDSLDHSYFGNGMLNHNTGKSLLAAHVICDTQKKGGVAVIIDTENSAAPEFWKSLGVDLTNLSYIPCETVEEIFEQMEAIISIVRKSNRDRILTIIVDSVAGASTKAELEADHGSQGYATQKAIIISKAMRKITNMIGRQKILILYTNQLRQNLNAAMFGDKYVVSGGKALAFHCSVRVRLSNMGKLKKGTNIIGNKCKCVVVKNRMGPPQRKAEFDIYFDSGIADYSSWLNVLKENSIISGAGGNTPYTYKLDSGEKVNFLSKDFVSLMSTNPSLKAELYSKICDAVIMKYKDPNSAIVEGVEVESEEEESTDVSDE